MQSKKKPFKRYPQSYDLNFMISERMLHTLVIFLKANLYWIAVQNTEFSNQNRVGFLKLIPYRDKIIIIIKKITGHVTSLTGCEDVCTDVDILYM